MHKGKLSNNQLRTTGSPTNYTFVYIGFYKN